MKKILAIAIMSLLFVSAAAAEVSNAPDKFKVTFEITYNELTLAEAAKLEAVVKEQHAKACKVGVEVRSIGDALSFISSDNNIILTNEYAK